MAKNRRKRANKDDAVRGKNTAGSDSGFMGFLKKRAPIYLGLVALFLIFVIPELTKGSLDDVMPELAPDDERIVSMLMAYSGPDGEGLSMAEEISAKITEEFGDNVYGHKDTAVAIGVVPHMDDGQGAAYDVAFEISTRDGDLSYEWVIDTDTGRVTADDPSSKHIVDIVNFYD